MKILVLGSVAVCGADQRWLLLNASAQIAGQPLLEAAAAQGRIAGVVLLDAQPEHAAGLAALGRAHALNLYATPNVFEELVARQPPLHLGERGCTVRWHLLPVAGDVRSAAFRIERSDSLRCVAVDDGGWPAPYSPHRREAVVGDRIALLVEDVLEGQRLVYAPGSGAQAMPWMEGADCLLVDASACPLEHGELAAGAGFAAAGARRTVLVHLDDCDPRLHEGTQARRAADAAGIEVAHDGMEIVL